MHIEENKSTLYESRNNCSDLTAGMDVTKQENKVTAFSKKFLRAIQGLICQHILMLKILLPYLFLVM